MSKEEKFKMGYTPHLRYGGELKHYRTVGSRNGVSNTPGYKAKGNRAVGRLVNGRYVYDVPPQAVGDPKKLGRYITYPQKPELRRHYDMSDVKRISNKNVQRQQSMNTAQQRGTNIAKNATTSASLHTKNSKAMANIQNKNAGLRARAQEAEDKRAAYNNSLIGKIDNATKGFRKNVDKTLDRTGRNFGSWLSDRRKQMAGAANNVGNWLGDRGKDAGNAANNVKNWAGEAGKNVGNAANNVKNWAGEAGKNVGNWLGDRGKDAGNAANNVKNWAGDRAKDASNAAGNAGNWLNDRFSDVKNAAGNASNWVGDRAKEAGEAIGKAASEAQAKGVEIGNNVRNAVTGGYKAPSDDYLDRATGNKKKNVFEQAGEAIGNTANNVKNWAGEAGKNVGNAAGNVRNWAGEAGKNAGDWVGNRAKDARNWAGEAGKNVGKAADDAKKWAKDRAFDAEYEVGKVADNVKGTAKRAAEGVKGFVEDIPYNAQNFVDEQIMGKGKDYAESWRNNAKTNRELARRSLSQNRKFLQDPRYAAIVNPRYKRELTEDATKEYKKRMDLAGYANDQAKAWQENYDNSLRGKADKAVSDAGDFVTGLFNGGKKKKKK